VQELRLLKRLVDEAGRDFSRFEITVGIKSGLKVGRDAAFSAPPSAFNSQARSTTRKEFRAFRLTAES
jgi:hypothetical protein